MWYRLLWCGRMKWRLTLVRGTRGPVKLRSMLHDIHQSGVCGQLLVPAAFRSRQRSVWPGHLLLAIVLRGMGLLMPSLVYACLHSPVGGANFALSCLSIERLRCLFFVWSLHGRSKVPPPLTSPTGSIMWVFHAGCRVPFFLMSCRNLQGIPPPATNLQ